MPLVFSFTDIFFWFSFLYFFVAVFLSFYVPGSVVLPKEKWTPLSYLVLSLSIGIVLWVFQGMVFGYLGIRWATYLYLLVMVFLWVRQQKFRDLRALRQEGKHTDKILLAIIVFGTLIQLISVWFIGYRSQEGISFCCFWPDSFYHLALINELIRNFPPNEPGMSGVAVRNYHFLANLVVAELSRVFRLSPIVTQYQYMPVVLSLLLGGVLVSFAQEISTKISFRRWLVFFLYFSGDIIFLLLFLLGKGWDFSVTVSENATTLWFSPPRFYAIVIFFAALTVFLSYLKKQTRTRGILLGLLIGSLTGFKIYLAFLALCGLGFVVLYTLLRRNYHFAVPLLVAGIVSAALYLPTNTGAGGLFFSGLWRIDDYAIRPAFGLMQVELAKQVYVQHGNVLRVFMIETMYFMLYVVSLFGVFLFGFFQTKQTLRVFPLLLHIFLLSGLFFSFFIGMFFLQNTGGANTLQFLFAVYVVGAIYAALAVHHWVGKIPVPWKIFVILLIVFLGSFRVLRETYYNVTDLQKKVGYYTVSPDEQAALEYVKTNIQKDAVIAIEPTIATEDSCYILSVVSDRGYFLCGSGILEDHGVPVSERVKAIQTIFTDKREPQVAQALREYNISYLYVPTLYVFGTTLTRDYLRPVYKNGTITILMLEREKMRR